MKIKAIVFDCYGVLATDGWLPFKEKHFGHDPELFKEAGELNRQTDSGFISVEDFINAISEMSGVPARQVKKELENNVPNDKLFEYIATELKPKYKIGFLSNSSGNALKRIFTKEQVGLLDAITLSYKLGVTKPQAEAYESVTSQLGVALEECVFIDDQERYATAARDIGMQAIWYRDFEQMKAELEQILVK